MSSPNFAYHGTLIHTPSLGTLSLLQNTLITISCGEITAITPNISKQDTPDVALTHDVSPKTSPTSGPASSSSQASSTRTTTRRSGTSAGSGRACRS